MLRFLLGIVVGVLASFIVWVVADGELPVVDEVVTGSLEWVGDRVGRKPVYCYRSGDPEYARMALEKLYEDRRNGIDVDAVCAG